MWNSGKCRPNQLVCRWGCDKLRWAVFAACKAGLVFESSLCCFLLLKVQRPQQLTCSQRLRNQSRRQQRCDGQKLNLAMFKKNKSRQFEWGNAVSPSSLPLPLPRPPLICFLSSLPQKPGQTHRQANTETAPDNANVSHCRRRAKKKNQRQWGGGCLYTVTPHHPPPLYHPFHNLHYVTVTTVVVKVPRCVCVCVHTYIYIHIYKYMYVLCIY